MIVEMKNFLISSIFDEYIYIIFDNRQANYRLIVPDMSVMYILCGNNLYVNENDLVYFLLN
jgi:hypothetical protein